MQLAQRVTNISRTPQIQRLWQYLEEVIPDIVAEAILIQQIPAPTFHELVRANHVLSRFGACALFDNGIDSLTNTAGRMAGSNPDLPAVLVSAHMDTVFEQNADLAVRHEADGRIFGPGLGDNSLGVAALIALADILRQFNIQPQADLWFVATSREEGLGNLGGIRHFFEREGERIKRSIFIEGMAFGRVFHAGLPSRRVHVICKAEGGHSWQHFGRPSAIHEIVRICARLVDIVPPIQPRTTYNIGIIEGGHSINSLASEAGFYLDMRSEDSEALAALDAQVREIIETTQHDDVTVEVDVVGDRPAGSIPVDHELVQAATAALQEVGITPSYEIGSTDANLPLSLGVPAVTVGVAWGGNGHRLDEYIDPAPLLKGMKQLILLTLAATGWEPTE